MTSDSETSFDLASVHLAALCAGDEVPFGLSADHWHAVVERAVQHRVVPILYSQLRKRSDLSLPDDELSALRYSVQMNAARTLALAGEMRKMLARFADAQIPVVVFKGIALSAALYDDVSMREAGDLDLLVHRKDIAAAVDLLVAAGHAPFFPTATPRESSYLSGLTARDRINYLQSHCEHHLVHPVSKLNVDLHWAFSLREFAVSLDPTALWSRAVTQSVAGFDAQTPGPTDMLVILCLNGGKDRWERLDRICDVAALVQSLPNDAWTEILSLAAQAGMARMLAIGLLLAVELLRAPVPTEVTEKLAQDRKAVQIADGLRRRLLTVTSASTPPKALGFGLDLQMRERVSDRLRYIAGHLRPGVGDWAAVPLPPILSPLHYVIRPFRLMTRYGFSQ